MKKLQLISAISLLTAAVWAKAPSSDWAVVEDIPPGWRIVVVTEFTFPCIFVHASHDELVCRIPQRHWEERNLPETRVRRDRIREVRVDRRNGTNALMGGAIGGGAGAIFGSIVNPGSRGPSAYGLGVIGTFLGARMGNDVHLLKGKVIFRAAPLAKQGKATSPTRASQSEEEGGSSAEQPAYY